jgi:hypothetical protein
MAMVYRKRSANRRSSAKGAPATLAFKDFIVSGLVNSVLPQQIRVSLSVPPASSVVLGALCILADLTDVSYATLHGLIFMKITVWLYPLTGAALLITLNVIHTINRKRPTNQNNPAEAGLFRWMHSATRFANLA